MREHETPATLEECLERLARTPVLLVACDYDGTLSPIVDDPARARPVRESLVALRQLAELPRTEVAVISGRSLRDLADLTGAPPGVHLVGSHGSEFDADFARRLSEEQLALRDDVDRQLTAIATGVPGAEIERKPSSVAFHYRNADQQKADEALAAIEKGPAAREGVQVKRGKMVLELTVVSTNKGRALETIRHRVGATAAIFIGDDVTDEDAFAVLKGPDVGVKVGEGESLAEQRIGDTDDVARLLADLAEQRARWIEGSEATPIQHHSMLSDHRTVALVAPDARITWMCAPRIDSAAIFAELLGGPSAGYFAVGPADESEPLLQEYDSDTLTLSTRWRGLTVVDYLDCSDGRPMQRAGRCDLIRVLEGRGRARIEFCPRMDFGQIATRLRVRDDGLQVEGSIDPVVLRAPGVEWTVTDDGEHQCATAEVDLSRGPIVLELRCGMASLRPAALPEMQRRRQTARLFAAWAERLTLPELRPDLVLRSALAIKGLVHGPTGAIAAAATTSLPETMGGVRNWDYRYCWHRDAAMAAATLVRLGSHGEALRFLDWLLGVVDSCCESPDRLAPLYTVTGGELGPEAELSQLSGYGGSRPVRIGNAASRQVQLDVFGPVVDLVHVLMESGAPLSSEHWRLVEAMATAVEHRWREPDHGIWEVRTRTRQHVHTKVMCWLTLDRAAHISEVLLGRERGDFLDLRDEIEREIFQHGWNRQRECFIATYDGGAADAAVLSVGLCGLLSPDDPRFVSTVRAVEAELLERDGVYRYKYDDGLPGQEGVFNLCTSWLIEAYWLIGRHDDAARLFDAYCALAGHTGMLAEEHDVQTGRALGNVPQAYSHLGLINAALRLSGRLPPPGRVNGA